MGSHLILEEVCVKCGKPQLFPVTPDVIRCPYCKDFFKPQAERIFLYEEELHRLSHVRPGQIFFRKPWLKRALFILFILAILWMPGIWKLLPFLGAIVLLVYNRYMLHHPVSSRMQSLESELQTLVRTYDSECGVSEENS